MTIFVIFYCWLLWVLIIWMTLSFQIQINSNGFGRKFCSSICYARCLALSTGPENSTKVFQRYVKCCTTHSMRKRSSLRYIHTEMLLLLWCEEMWCDLIDCVCVYVCAYVCVCTVHWAVYSGTCKRYCIGRGWVHWNWLWCGVKQNRLEHYFCSEVTLSFQQHYSCTI